MGAFSALDRTFFDRFLFICIPRRHTAAVLRNRAFSVAVWETIHNRIHSSDEYVLIENLITDCKVFAALFLGT